MWKVLIYILLINIAVVALAVGISWVGYNHDLANRLYPEVIRIPSEDLSIAVYGQRWKRLLETIIAILLICDVAVGYLWYRKQQSLNERSFLNSGT